MGFITIKASSGKNMFGTFSKHHGQANPSKSKIPFFHETLPLGAISQPVKIHLYRKPSQRRVDKGGLEGDFDCYKHGPLRGSWG